MSKFDLTPEEQAVWQEFRYSTKAIIAQLLGLREATRTIAQSETQTPQNQADSLET